MVTATQPAAPPAQPGEPLVRRAARMIYRGTAVDLGAGIGIDALHLAWQGISVLAVDRRADKLAHVGELAARERLPLTTWIGDAVDVAWPDEVDIVVAVRVLHLIERSRALALVTEAQERTSPGGVHVVAAFGGGYDPTDRRRLFLERDELRDLYAGWDEVAGRSHAFDLDEKRASGRPWRFFQHATLMRKPEDD